MNNLEKAIFLSKMRENVLGKLNDGSIPTNMPEEEQMEKDLYEYLKSKQTGLEPRGAVNE